MRQLAVLSVVSVLAGCAASQVPIPTAHPISYQKKASAAHHWDVLADEAAGQAVAVLGKDSALKQYPLYVAPAKQGTTFNRVLRDLLTTRLVERGFDVRTTSAGALEVTCESQLVYHQSERHVHFPETVTAVAGLPPRTEVIVTTSISQAGRYLMRRNDIYYVDGADYLHFIEPRPVPTNLRTWKVVGEK